MTGSVVELLQPYLDNTLDPAAGGRALVAGIMGDRPSQGAKSPSLWNAAFRHLNMDALFVPLDVSQANLPGLMEALRGCPQYAGGSVTVPHKIAVMELLDEVDSRARRMGAVNTIRRTPDGRLVGYNSDAQGAIDSLLKTMPWDQRPFLDSVEGMRLLLIGAGGAARAVAFALAEAVGRGGHLTVVNRTPGRARQLAEAVNEAFGNASAQDEEEVPRLLTEVDLVVNASTRGQSGIRRLPKGKATCLEPYSSLAPASPAELVEADYPSEAAFYRAWYEASVEDIRANLAQAARGGLQAGPGVRFFDVVYSPLESVLLAQARLSGHPTLSGKGMNLAQAVDGFVNWVMSPHLQEMGWDLERAYTEVAGAMAQVW